MFKVNVRKLIKRSNSKKTLFFSKKISNFETMQLSQYISDLLYRYDCVTVPNFGAFISQTVSASLDDSTHAFYPPKKRLSFNAQLQTNDGLLASYIAKVEQISFEKATKKLHKQAVNLTARLNKGEIVQLKHIGDLELSEHGTLLFSPSYQVNYLTSAFGLDSFVSHSIDRQSKDKVAPILVSSHGKKRHYMQYAAIAVIALGLGGFLSSNFYLNQIEQHNALAQQTAAQELDSKIQEATFVIDNPLPAVMLNIRKQSGNFHIVAGAFRVESNCDKKLKQLLNLGYNARRIGVNNYGLHQVVYDSFETRQQAQTALRQIRQKEDRNAWLLIKQLH